MENIEYLNKFASRVAKLKEVKRTGWTYYKEIKDVESVADHSYRMAMLCMAFSKFAEVDVSKCVKMALMHDLAEAVVGDIAP